MVLETDRGERRHDYVLLHKLSAVHDHDFRHRRVVLPKPVLSCVVRIPPRASHVALPSAPLNLVCGKHEPRGGGASSGKVAYRSSTPEHRYNNKRTTVGTASFKLVLPPAHDAPDQVMSGFIGRIVSKVLSSLSALVASLSRCGLHPVPQTPS